MFKRASGFNKAIAFIPSRRFSCTPTLQADFTHAVIGGGVVGLAIARQLSLRAGSSVVLLERHAAVGTETSSRNSEVIHAGIYYPADSLKTRLCVRGRRMLYDLCGRYGVPHARVGKWIVAQTHAQREGLEKIYNREHGVPLRWVSAEEVRNASGGVVRAERGGLESPETGIVDSHALMGCLHALLTEAGGVVALNSPVQRLKPLAGGWEVCVPDGSVEVETIVNAAGLGAVDVHNMILPGSLSMFYAKGNYFSCTRSFHPRISRLVYPAPEDGAPGLGTHLTLDMAGRIRFGPDVEWVQRPDDLRVSMESMAQAVGEIRKYLPALGEGDLAPDYAGIRPKLAPGGGVVAGDGFQDFIIRREDGFHGWINLLGIESPGLTSCLAIAEMVEQLLYGNVTR